MSSVHAMTDVTGFGLLGHLLGMCRGDAAGARIDFARLPLHPGVLALIRQGVATGASERNWAAYEGKVRFDDGVDASARALLTDPQTSGGLLVACAAEATARVLEVFADGFEHATRIGEFVSGPAGVTLSQSAMA